MRKVVAAINMTLDGIGDHTSVDPDEAIHQHYTDLLNEGDVILYGRITYELMGYWQNLLANPSGDKTMDDFAVAMNRITKVVFSHQVKTLDWDTANLALKSLEEEVSDLRNAPGKDILVGSRSLIIQLMNLDLIDEYQFCIHPVVAGTGMRIFDEVQAAVNLKLINTKTFTSGAIILYYERPSKT